MATYNGERFLQEQLDSITRQTLTPLELVVTDDGSTDSTVGILHAFKAQAPFPVRIYQNEERLGHIQNFFKAMSLCRGELISLSDQDDIWSSHKLRRMQAAFEDDGVVLAIHSGLVVDESLHPLGWRVPDIKRDEVLPALHKLRGFEARGFAMMFRADLPLVLQWKQRFTHDWWIYFLAQTFGRIAYIKEPLVQYRRHDASVTQQRNWTVWQDCNSALSATAETYQSASEGVRFYSQLLQDMIPELDEADLERGEIALQWYVGLEQLYRQRSEVYCPHISFIRRITVLYGLWKTGAYAKSRTVGWSRTSLCKDFLMGCLSGSHLLSQAGTLWR